MSGKPERYSRLAGVYSLLETFVYGDGLRRARKALLPRLNPPRRVLILGDTNARMLRAILERYPVRDATMVEFSEGMLARALVRAERAPWAAHCRLHWHLHDARTWDYPAGAFDLVVTTFFLDLFQPTDAQALVRRFAHTLRPGGQWLEVDFAPGAPWWARLRRQAAYRFFRMAVGLRARELPPTEQLAWAGGFGVVDRWQDPGGECQALLLSLAKATPVAQD